MQFRPDTRRRLAAALLTAAGGLPCALPADPYQVEVLVFARPADPAAPMEANEHRPGCLARARPPSASPAAQGAPAAVGTDGLRLATEARALQRSSTGLQVLAHSEIPETHLIRIGPILGEVA